MHFIFLFSVYCLSGDRFINILNGFTSNTFFNISFSSSFASSYKCGAISNDVTGSLIVKLVASILTFPNLCKESNSSTSKIELLG